MQKVHQLHQGLLGLVLTGHVGKALAGLGLHIDLGVTLAKGHGVAAHTFAHKIHEQLPQAKKDQNGQNPVFENAYESGILLRHNLRKFHLAFNQAVHQLWILHTTGNINFLLLLILAQSSNTLIRNFHLGKLALIHHFHKGVIGHIMHLRAKEGRHNYRVDE